MKASNHQLTVNKTTVHQLITEFQANLTGENKNNLKFIKFVIDILNAHHLELPTLPEVANKILALSQSKEASFQDYASVIKNDPSIALKVIKLANSPLYRGIRDVSEIDLALNRIGIDGLRNIVLTDSINSVIFKNKKFKEHIQTIWKNSILIALLTSKLSEFLKLNKSHLYTISLVHRIGSIVLFDIVEKFNKITDYEHYLTEDFALRAGEAFNKKLTIEILENWFFTKEQIISVKNYDIKPIPVAPLEHKLLYLSQITIHALEVIKKDYDPENLFPYTFMIQEANIDIAPEVLREATLNASHIYEEVVSAIYSQ